MKITLNGGQREVPDGLTVEGLLQFLNLQQQRVAVELNLEIVRKGTYDAVGVKDGDTVEVVSFMGGGAQ
jgi:sulfur carrier protein